MGWREKLNLRECFLFCEQPRTREEIMENFNLTPIEGWHSVKYLMKLKSDIITQKNVGRTGRAYIYKTRKATIDEIMEEIDDEKYEEAMKALKCI